MNKSFLVFKVFISIIVISVLCSCSTGKAPDTPADVIAAGYDVGIATDYIYSDGSSLYMNPKEPSKDDSVTLKIRTKKDNASGVYLYYGTGIEDFKSIEMRKGEPVGEFDYYFAVIPPSEEIVYYYYEVRQYMDKVYYSRRGVEKGVPVSSVQFKMIPNFKTPDWMKGAVLYHIFPDRFFNGDTGNDVVDNEYMYDNWPAVFVEDWDQLPDSDTPYDKGSDRTREFYGGDLEGIIQKLDYLKELGIEGIYLNPIFVSPSNHKYDTQDYNYIDPHLGVIVEDGGEAINPGEDPNYQNEDMDNASAVNKDATKYIIRTTSEENLEASNEKMKELISKAHELGIRVILDGVFNHCGSFNKWLDREHIYPESKGPGAYESEDSPFIDYFVFSENEWPDNESYESWWGYKTLPKLNYEGSDELLENIISIAEMWVGQEYNADGWRIDVAAEIGHSPGYNHEFYQMLRERVKDANPEAVILGEVYGNASSWLMGDEWDTIMNYDAFFDPVSWFLTGIEKHSYSLNRDLHNNTEIFDTTLKETMAIIPYPSLETAMNQLDNHDHSRFLTRTSGNVDAYRDSKDISKPEEAGDDINKGILKEAVIMQMTMPGAPTLYYGDEAGVVGWTDPDCRRTYPWGNEDEELLSFYKDIISIHKEYSSIKTGSLITLLVDSENFVYAYGRWDLDNRVVVAINNNSDAQEVSIPVWQIGLESGDTINQIFSADKETHGIMDESVDVISSNGIDGVIKVTVPAYGGVVLAKDEGTGEPPADITDIPEIVEISPADDSIDVPVDEIVTVEFSENMNPRDILDAFSIEPAVEGKFVWSGPFLYFIPEDGFSPDTKYTVRIDGNITTISGNVPLKEKREWTFTTLLD